MTLPSFFISRAWSKCTPEQVTEVFNSVLGEDVVESVKFCEKTDWNTNVPFKIFWVNLKKSTAVVEEMVERLKTEEFIKIDYDYGWFWKVTINKPKETKPTSSTSAAKFVPRILPRES